MCEQCDKVKKALVTRVDDVRAYVLGMIIARCSIIESLMCLPLDELPLKINEYAPHTPEHTIIKYRLEGKDPFQEKLGTIMDALYDVEFNYEDYRGLGYNDGTAETLAQMLDLMDDPENASRAREAIYSE